MTSEGVGNATAIPANDWVVPWHVFSRCGQCVAHLLAKRREVKAKMGSWKDAMADAAWVWILFFLTFLCYVVINNGHSRQPKLIHLSIGVTRGYL